jgi:hypothetical protein
MIYFDKLDKVSNLIARITPSLIIRHVVDLKSRSSNRKDANVSDFAYHYSFDNSNGGNKYSGMYKAPLNIQGIQFRSQGHIVIESFVKSISQKDGDTASKKVSIAIWLQDSPLFINSLENVLLWFTSENVFLDDSRGQPFKIIDPLLKVTCPLQFETAGIVFKPCIIHDTQDNRYQGVSIGNREKGEISSLTATEFINFKNIISYSLNNLYISNMALINEALQYCTYSNLMEDISNRERRK